MKITLQVRGFEELKRDLARLDAAAQGRMVRNATMAGARVAAKQARQNAPVATGKLKKSIKARWGAASKRSPRQEALVNARVFYAGLVEFGTVHNSPQPYMRPAVDEKKTEILAKMASNLQNGLERELKRQSVSEDEGEA